MTWEAEEPEGAAGSWKGEPDSTLEGLTSGTPRLRFSRDQRLLQVQLGTVSPVQAVADSFVSSWNHPRSPKMLVGGMHGLGWVW